MLVNKFPLNLPIQEMNEQDDILMMDELTPVSTPTDQVIFNYNSFPEPPKCGRTLSVSSIASSVSNFSTNHDLNLTSFANHYKLTESFDNLLYDTYQKYQDNPTITPFNELNPPSGVINNVTKEALRIAMEKGIDVGIEINNYALTIIRQKLIQLCKTNTSRTNSVTSLTNFPSLNLSTRFNSDLKTPTEGLFNFEPPHLSTSSGTVQGLQPSFVTEQNNICPISANPSPINEYFVPDGLFNATSNRKRESLRLKRSGNQASF